MARERANQNYNFLEILIDNNEIILIIDNNEINCTAELNEFSKSNNIHQYQNQVLTDHNVTKVKPMSLIKEIIVLNNRNYTIYKYILLILKYVLVLTIISIFYPYVKCKTAPHNITITLRNLKKTKQLKNFETV